MSAMRSISQRHCRTDSKVNYGRRRINQIASPEQEEAPGFFDVPDEPQRMRTLQDLKNQVTQPKRETQISFKRQTQEFGGKKKESGLKSLLLLAATLVLLIGIVIFEVSIYFGPDQDCWREFKENGCSISNPSGPTCKRLVQCLSGDNWKINLFYFLVASFLAWGGYRFRRQIRVLSVRALELWERFLDDR